MATSAKVTFKVQDRSAIIPAMDGVYTAVVVNAIKGPEEPTLVPKTERYLKIYGTPDPKLGVSAYSALNYLSNGNKLWVVRSVADDATYAAALVRAKVLPVDTTDPFATFSDESLVIKPLANGLGKDEFDSFVFPLYHTNKEYEESIADLTNSVFNTDEIPLDTTREFKEGDYVSFSSKTLDELNSPDDDVGETTATYKVLGTGTRIDKLEKIRLTVPVDVLRGDEIHKIVQEQQTVVYPIGADDPDNPGTPLTQEKTKTVTVDVAQNIPGNPTVIRDATGSVEILVSNSDYIHPGDKLQISTTAPQNAEFISKDLYEEEVKFLKINEKIDVDQSLNVYRLIQAEFEERDAFLVASSSRGFDGNNVSIGITPSKNYEEAFNILVYYKGVLQEPAWEVTRDYFLDGFQRQMFIEDKVNGSSFYIMIKNNPNCVDRDGNLLKPLNTDHSLWRQDPDDVFNATGIFFEENMLLNHKELYLSDLTGIGLGTRMRFILDETGKMSKEYKVRSMNNVANTVMLDRPLEENKIPKEYTSFDGTTVYKTEVYKFDPTLNDSANSIRYGVRYFPIKRLDKVFYNYPINAHFVISGISGVLLDPGANLLTGGDLGSPTSVGDLILSLNKLCNREATPTTLIMDGGYTHVAYANAILALTEKQGLSHGFLSNSFEAESKADPLKATLDYRDSLMINNRNVSLFSGWIKHYDEYNKRYVWTSPESYAVVSQSFTTRNYQFFTPAAGWERGKVRGDDIRVKWEEGERDILIENQINPIRYKRGSGLVIWGNETLLVKPSPLQLRSVNMLIIAIKYGLEAMLEYRTFNFNNEREWVLAEGSIDAFMRDEIKAKEGVYDYKVAIKDVITKFDIDNRKMPVFLGIQPTMDIQEIPVTLAIYNSSVDIDVSL